MCSCHDKVHNDELKINGYIETSKGIELNYEIIEKKEHMEIKGKKVVKLGNKLGKGLCR